MIYLANTEEKKVKISIITGAKARASVKVEKTTKIKVNRAKKLTLLRTEKLATFSNLLSLASFV